MKTLFLILFTLVYSKDLDDIALDDIDFDEPDLSPPPPMVVISDGTLKGVWEKSDNGRQFASFKKVPYAAPPVGELRFKAPEPAKPWIGAYDASKNDPYSNNCLQFDPFFNHISGSEDCLFAYVHTPRLDPEAAMPVMVFIHGGAFFYGAGFAYDPIRLLDRDIVVVTFNYRLGPLGFLSTGDEVIPGNAGLKDQVMMLQWVKKNIKAFGGDPDNVTIVGFSSGAASVHYLYLSPMARGTFTRGIAMSGSALAPWAYDSKPAKKTKQLADLLNCTTESSQAIADCLMETQAAYIVSASKDIYIPDWKERWFSPFMPTAEPAGIEGAFLTQHPYKATKEGAMFDAPLLVTSTSEEGLYPAAAFQADPAKIFPEIEKRWHELAPELFHYNDTLPVEDRISVADKIKEFYFKGKPVTNETFHELVQALGDRNMVTGIGKMAELHAANSRNPVHMYKYSFICETTFSLVMSWNYEENYGVSHGDDVFHIFNLPLITPETQKGEDRQMNDVLVDLVYNYCKNGVPKMPKSAPKWSPLKPGSPELKYIEILSPSKFRMRSSSDFGHRRFWDSLGFREE